MQSLAVCFFISDRPRPSRSPLLSNSPTKNCFLIIGAPWCAGTRSIYIYIYLCSSSRTPSPNPTSSAITSFKLFSFTSRRFPLSSWRSSLGLTAAAALSLHQKSSPSPTALPQSLSTPLRVNSGSPSRMVHTKVVGMYDVLAPARLTRCAYLLIIVIQSLAPALLHTRPPSIFRERNLSPSSTRE